MSDWKDDVKDFAPAIGGLLATFGGPVGALAGAGITAIANAIGVPSTGDPTKDEAAITAALSGGISPEQKAALIAADKEVRLATVNAGVETHKTDAVVEQSYIADVADARAHNANTVGILRLGYIINIFSYLCLACVLYGCFWLMGGVKLTIDPGIAAMVGGIIGAAVQWLMSNAAQANGFFFGSSPQARQSATDMGKAVGVPPPTITRK